MRAIPIPPGVAAAAEGRTIVIGDDDPTRDDLRPCEYVVTPSDLYPGHYVYSALVEMDDSEVEAIAAGCRRFWLTLDGAEVPWSISLLGRVGEAQ